MTEIDEHLYLRLTLWASGGVLYWPAADVGPMVVLAPEQARHQQPDRDAPTTVPATVLRGKGGGTYSEWVRETPDQILDLLHAGTASVGGVRKLKEWAHAGTASVGGDVDQLAASAGRLVPVRAAITPIGLPTLDSEGGEP